MRLFVILLLFSCTTQKDLKFKYSNSKRHFASLTRHDVSVSKINGELKQSKILASGMDSTFIFVKLFDQEGNLLMDVDPADLTLSTNVDIEAKPFTLKQGIYKAEILPRVKSRLIRIRVDWQEKVMSSEIILDTSVAPVKDEIELGKEIHFQTINVAFGRGSSEPTDGFTFENTGDNKIVRSKKFPNSGRTFNFDYPEQARQNISFEVDDFLDEAASQTMHSMFWIFPRKQVPVLEHLTGRMEVTLANGEKMIFSSESKMISGGVFTEGPVDLAADIFKRRFPDLKYQGRGVILRVNARGQSPQLDQVDGVRNLKIDFDHGSTGTEDALIIHGLTGQRCRRPKTDFWDPIEVAPILFKFPTDEEFDLYLRNNCGFGLPKF